MGHTTTFPYNEQYRTSVGRVRRSRSRIIMPLTACISRGERDLIHWIGSKTGRVVSAPQASWQLHSIRWSADYSVKSTLLRRTARILEISMVWHVKQRREFTKYAVEAKVSVIYVPLASEVEVVEVLLPLSTRRPPQTDNFRLPERDRRSTVAPCYCTDPSL